MYYTRNVDPDQEQPWTYNYKTRNYIYYQPSKPEGIDGKINPYDFAAVSRLVQNTQNWADHADIDKRTRGYDLFGYGFDARPREVVLPFAEPVRDRFSSTLKTANQYSADVQTARVEARQPRRWKSFDVKYWYLLSFPTYEASSSSASSARLRLRLSLLSILHRPPRIFVLRIVRHGLRARVSYDLEFSGVDAVSGASLHR